MSPEAGNKWAGDWDAYWRNASSTSAHKDGGPQDEALEHFWLGFFGRIFPGFPAGAKMLDIACGNGAVAGFAASALLDAGMDIDLTIYGLDESCAALGEMRRRYPGLEYMAAHAAQLPIREYSFDLVTSQFGMEYAGPDAVMEAARVVRPGGIFCAILHLHGGAIYRECAVNLEAIDAMRDSRLLPCFEALFQTALAVQRGQGGREMFLDADKAFAGAVAQVEAVLRHRGKGVADGMLFRLYSDVAHMYRQFKHYDPAEVFTWIHHMAGELDAYRGRMASMLEAALDGEEFERFVDRLTASQFTIQSRKTLTMGKAAEAAAWTVEAQKSN